MLTALELQGFKSFADRTRFEFPDGITVVVGPNGSGKSNIVDAIKWVLGSQSAKSLRGADMADVIFKGSASGGRKPAQAAEATLVFDNSQSQLPIEAAEVQVTRRVFRSGESEYLINQQPCRLKDIKDLFRGTGVGVDAYSLIEQGKVDRMLQATSKDRRLIFEEAAGISRFKAKKVETERRLARVEQHLLRLKDLVDEVGSRYHSLQQQASRASRYRALTGELQQWRVRLGLTDLQSLQRKRDAVEQQRQEWQTTSRKQKEELERSEASVGECEARCQESIERVRAIRESLSQLRQQIVRLEGDRERYLERVEELHGERERLAARLQGLRQRVVSTEEQFEKLSQSHQLHQEELQRVRQRVQEAVELEGQTSQSVADLKGQLELLRGMAIEATQACQELRARKSSLQQKSLLMDSHLQEIQGKAARLAESARRRIEKKQGLLDQRQEWSLRWDEARSRQAEAYQGLRQLRERLLAYQDEAVDLQGKVQGIRERLAILEQLESEQEGIGVGTRTLLEQARQSKEAPWRSLRGMVADLIQTEVHLAPLIDAALGTAAETLVLEDDQIIHALRSGACPIEGRVQLLRLDRLAARRSGEKIQLDGLRGVLGRADRLVTCADDLLPLVRFLLGTTWLVDSLDTALDLSHLRGAGLRFVTASCERVDPDGTLTFHALKNGPGLIVRRSELLNARALLEQTDRMAAEHQRKVARLHAEITKAEQQAHHCDQRAAAGEQRIAMIEAEIATIDDAIMDHSKQVESQQAKVRQLELDSGGIRKDLERCEEELVGGEQQMHAIEVKIDLAKETWEAALRLRDQQHDATTALRIELAKEEQRAEGEGAMLLQWSKDRQERRSAVRESLDGWAALKVREEQLQLATLELTGELASLHLKQQDLQQSLSQLEGYSQQRQQELVDARQTLDRLRRQWERSEDRLKDLDHEEEVATKSAEELIQRYLEEYQIDFDDPMNIEQIELLKDRHEAERHMSRLRQEIAEIGSVNMEALKELDSLQERFQTLRGHHADLVAAKESLEKVIQRLNEQSRKVFLETLEAVRRNFQELYRKAFGGGHADLILEQGEDVLESGIEIVATPPGKTSLHNSLLSGGEKALTAVALIMAIFQHRPSPFCVLDEVDAPFDEANIGRFVQVLKEFLDWTKFIVVTHSKKTMTAANTLYGVTMQENGVSVEVSVRFEDVDDQGRILPRRGGAQPKVA
jgi:chromosome segregation protein